MIFYNEERFKEILSEFILCSERGFETLKEKDYGGYAAAIQEDLYEVMMKMIGDIISKQLNPKDYGINNLLGANVGVPSYKKEIYWVLAYIFNTKMQIEILESLRKCKSWKEVIDFKDRFIEVYNDVSKEYYQSKFIDNFEDDEGVLFFIYITYLAQHGIYAIDDHLYNELNVSKKGIDRLRFDYARNGLPFSTIPYLHVLAEVDNEKIGFLHNTMIKVEEEFISHGELSPTLMSDFKYLASCHKTLLTDLSFANITKDKFKALVYRYIDILESSVLACSENHIEIDYTDYAKIVEFNKRYKSTISNIETVEELEEIFETYSELYTSEAKELQNTFLDYASNVLSCEELFNIRKILGPFQDVFISKQEVLVITNHAIRLKAMFMGFGQENINPVAQLISEYFKTTENRIAEIKNNTESTCSVNVSTKKINKKIAKYKKAFHFKDINKLAEQAGFSKVRQNGDHGIFQKLDGTTVVIPQGRNIGKGLSYKIQKEIQMS